MCGIAGLICFADKCREEDHISLVKKMSGLQTHRGPDDSGAVSLGHVCLGSTRLSIIDLSEAGHMPMSNEDGSHWISYNGEVYNFNDLREELLSSGHHFRSKTDTEVVLHAYEEWGDKALDRFVGMFGFAVYSKRIGTVTLVRDRFGIKPVYYMKSDGHVLFASEIKTLVQVKDQVKANRQRLIEWWLYRNIDVLSSETLVEDIHSVLPGHLVTIDQQGAISSRCYYSPISQVDPGRYERFGSQKPQEVIAEIEQALEQSVTDRLVSDVPVGTLCSGGLDSSLITAIAARHHPNIRAFNVSVQGYSNLDESLYAERLTKDLGVPLISYPLTGEAFRRELPRAVYLDDLPLTHPNSVAFSLICQVARANGVIVLLSGEGADELFGGYSWRYRNYRTLLRAQSLLSALPFRMRKMLGNLGYASSGMPVTSFLFGELLPSTVSLIDNYARKEWYEQCEGSYAFTENRYDRAVLGAMLGDIADFLSPLLRRLDRMSMGASVECRVPFLDHRLVKKAINLPLKYRINGNSDKWVLKQIGSRYLSNGIVNRKKVGFPLPLQDYLAPLAKIKIFEKGFCEEFLGLRAPGIQKTVSDWSENIQAFFSLLCLELWGRIFFFREPPEQVSELLLKFQ